MITYNWFALDDDADRARERVRPAVASALGPSAEPHLRPLPFGDELLAVLEAESDVAPHLRPEWLDSLAVVGDLAGCVEQIRRLHEAGSGTVVLLPIPGEAEEESFAAAGRVAAELRRT